MNLRPRTLLALTVVAAAALAGLALQRGRRAAPPPTQPTSADSRYWYLDIYDDFFAKDEAPGAPARFVSRRPLTRPSSFPVVKSTDTFRVFVLGGSVAAQYESVPGPIAGRTLKDVLGRILPGRRVEVVHCGMGAYDSYRESLILKEVLHYAPDLIVLMSGNNDSRADAGRPPVRVMLALRLRRWLGLRMPPRPASAQPARPRASGPPPAFARNLRGMVLAARGAGAATVLCALPRRLTNAPTAPLPAWLWQPEPFRAWNPSGAGGLAAAAAFWRKVLARRPDEDLGHYFLARTLARQGDAPGARREYLAAKRCREPWDSNPIVRQTAADLGMPLADLEAAFDGLPYALEGGKIYRDPTHWYRFLDPLVSYTIARALLQRPAAVRARLEGAWLAGEGSGLAAPRPDLVQIREDFLNRLSWAVWESPRGAPRLSEQVLMVFEDLRRLDAAGFTRLPQLKEACRGIVSANVWTRSTAGEFERRWAYGLAHAAELARRDGELGRTVELFTQARRGAPDMEFWKLYQAVALWQLGRKEEAARLLGSLAGLEPAFPEVLQVGILLGLRSAPPDPSPPPQTEDGDLPLQKQAERLEAAGRLKEALYVLRPMPRQKNPDPAVLLTALRMAVAAQDRRLAQDCLSRARQMRLPPRHVALVADALRRLGRAEEALSVIDEALARAPRDAKLLNDKGVLEVLLGRPDDAQAALVSAIAADPDLGAAYQSLGALRASRGDVAGARRTYAAALSRRSISGDSALRRQLQDALRGLPAPGGKPPAHRL